MQLSVDISDACMSLKEIKVIYHIHFFVSNELTRPEFDHRDTDALTVIVLIEEAEVGLKTVWFPASFLV